MLIQAQNSFNEKGAQFLLIPLGVWLYGAEGDLEYPLGAIIVLPFILFSPFVGWLSDRFCKARIINSWPCSRYACWRACTGACTSTI